MMLLVPALMVGAIGCAGPSNHTERGAATGAVLGGLAGAVIGHNKNRRGAEGAATVSYTHLTLPTNLSV